MTWLLPHRQMEESPLDVIWQSGFLDLYMPYNGPIYFRFPLWAPNPAHGEHFDTVPAYLK